MRRIKHMAVLVAGVTNSRIAALLVDGGISTLLLDMVSAVSPSLTDGIPTYGTQLR
jgi:hypothetical protein